MTLNPEGSFDSEIPFEGEPENGEEITIHLGRNRWNQLLRKVVSEF